MTKSERVRRADPHRHFLTHCAVMPGWHKAVVLLAALVAVAGLAGTLYARSATGSSAPDKHAGESAMSVASLCRYATPALMIGSSILIGFVGGWFFRAFLVPAAGLAFLCVAALFALSHFGILHPSAAGAATDAHASSGAKAGGGTSWFAQYAVQLKDVAMAHLPSASGGVVAAFLGFRRW
jgi:uncharacterized membrane protein (Fun14 family)